MTVTTLAYIPSPAQGVWFIGAVPIRAYALCIIIGIIAALVIGDRRWEARGGERGVIYDIALWAVPFGLIGGRIYHVLTDWPTYFGAGGAGLSAAFRIWDGGLGIWGAVALGAVGAWIACRRRGIPLPAFGDAIAPGIILAQAIGRLGNYFNQELYGRATTLPWGLEIYERRDAEGFRDTLNGVSTGEVVGVVHPTFLYELLWNLLIFALLLWVDRRYKLGHGRVFALYVAGYCLGRFWIELMRSDAATLIAGIRVNSFTSTFIFIAAVVYIMVAPRGREEPASLRGNAPIDQERGVDEAATEVLEVGAVAGVVAAAKVAGAAEGEDAAGVGEPSVADAADEADEVEAAVSTDVLEIGEEPEAVTAVDGDVEDSPEAEAEAVDADVEAAGEVAEGPESEVDEMSAEEAEAQDEAVVPDDEPESEEDTTDAADSEADDSPEAEAETGVIEADVEAAGDGAEASDAEIDEASADEPAAQAEGDTTEDEAADSPEAEAAAIDADVEPNVADEEPVSEGDSTVAAEEAVTEDAVTDSPEAQVVPVQADGDVETETETESDAPEPQAEKSSEAEALESTPSDADVAEDPAEPPADETAAEPADVTADTEESPAEAEVESDTPAEADSEPEVAAADSASEETPAEAQAAESGTESKTVGERFRKPRWFRRNS